jgi:hypothetical protein
MIRRPSGAILVVDNYEIVAVPLSRAHGRNAAVLLLERRKVGRPEK